jgi:hypothetical protein
VLPGQIDNRILKLSLAAGVDLRPLIHFWGVHPQDTAALALAITNNNLQPSALICNRLVHYQSIIPMNNAQFGAHAQVFFNGPVPAGGNPDYGNGWYNVWLPLYNNLHADSAVAAMQNIIDLYFPGGCSVISVPEEIIRKKYVSVSPNPTGGTLTIYANGGSSPWAEVLDNFGRVLIRDEKEVPDGQARILNLNALSNGVYLLRVNTGHSLETSKVAIVK